MEIYILDSDFRRVEVIDKFESLVWTERFQAHGDFELYLNPTQKVKTLFTYGTRLITNKSNRIMVVEEVENKTETDGTKLFIVKGTSLETILQDRVASYGLARTNYKEKGRVAVSLSNAFVTETTPPATTAWYHEFVTGDEIFFTSTGNLPGRILLDPSGVTNDPVLISAFNTTSDYFRFNQHNLKTGDRIAFKSGGTLPGGITAGTFYYAIVVDADLLAIATTKTNAFNGTKKDITTVGSGSHNLFLMLESNTSYWVQVTGVNSFKIALTYDQAMSGDVISEIAYGSGTHTAYHLHRNKWRVVGTKTAILSTIFTKFCVDGYLSTTDIIPYYASGDIYGASNIPVDTTIYTLDLNTDTVYNVIKQLCEVWGLGFRITRKYEDKQIQFNIYSGNNRTLSQTVLSPVVFDKDMESLINESEYTSIREYKNVAYVFAPNGYRTVYSNDASSSNSGFNKNILYVDASDIDLPAGITLDARLDQRGQEMLSRYKTLTAFDGEINNSYVYDLDYMLGDLVEVKNSNGYTNIKRVTEQIFSDDIEGEKSYPTLSSELVFAPNSWLYYDNQATWSSTADTLTWSSSILN